MIEPFYQLQGGDMYVTYEVTL